MKTADGRGGAARIEDYATVGDTYTVALIGRNGSIDWLCLPRFDAPACFAALLGNKENGRWMIAPTAEPLRIERRYRDETLILETEFVTDSGRVRIDTAARPRFSCAAILRLLNREMVLENNVVFGSVNANRRHYEAAAASLALADREWLARMITRRVPLTDWRTAFIREEGDIKTVLSFSAA